MLNFREKNKRTLQDLDFVLEPQELEAINEIWIKSYNVVKSNWTYQVSENSAVNFSSQVVVIMVTGVDLFTLLQSNTAVIVLEKNHN